MSIWIRVARSACLVSVALLLQAQDRPAPAAKDTRAGPGARGELGRAQRLAARRSRGMRTIFDAPQLVARETGGRTVPLARNAVLAEERYLVPSLRMAIEADVTVGQPFRVRFPAGALLLVRAGDPGRSHCLLPDPAPRDEQGRAYPDVCLIDRDGDGRHEVARFQSEDPDRPPRDMPVAPVALRRLPPADQPGLISFVAAQRLRVIRVGGGRAIIIAESRLAPRGIEVELPWSSRSTPAFEAVLPLEEGAAVRLAGMQLTATRGPSGEWAVRTEGGFADWLTLREQNTVIDTGAATMGAQ